ncbi:MAG: hypothetical protein KatS3mg110_0418 [Pirellulaceae bacterium]|nr:MAG: hypothetical protein KatS3mg110_0418 [Pirellulaceae bacterium]
MCLGIPGKVVRWLCREGVAAAAEIEFESVRRVCHMACVPEAEEGDYVIVHAGIAISRIDPQEVVRFQEELANSKLHDEWPLTETAGGELP